MEFIYEFFAEFFVFFGLEILPKYTGALLLWLYHKREFGYSHYLYEDDEKQALGTSRIGCVFYIIIAIVCIIICNI